MLSGEQNPGPATETTLHNRWSRRNLLLLGVACVIPVFYFAYVWHYGVNSFWEDDWSRIPLLDAARHGNLTLGLLWAQYNENRLLIPNLIWVAFDQTTHANAKSMMLFDACLLVASYAFLLVIFRRVADRWLDPLQTIVVGLVWFSLADWQNALWSFQIAWYLIIFFLMAMLLVLSRRQITPVILVFAMALAAAASVSSLQGLFAWPVGLLCIVWRLEERSRKVSYSVSWVLVGAITTGLYFWHYTFQGTAGVGVAYDLRNANLVVEFLLAAVGNVIPVGSSTSVALHALIGIPLLLASGWVLFSAVRERMRATGPHALPLSPALIVFALLFDVSIAFGRVNLGIQGALASRYTMANLLIIIGITLFVFERVPTWREIAGPSVSLLRTVGIVAVAVLLVVQIASSTNYGVTNARATQSQRVQGARIAANLSSIPKSVRGELVSSYLFAPYFETPINFTLVRQDELGGFAPGPYKQDQALGPPRKAIQKAAVALYRSVVAWCNLTPGETKAQVISKIGKPVGSEFERWKSEHAQQLATSGHSDEWDVGDLVLVAVFDRGHATSFDAYGLPISSPPMNTLCRANS